MSRAGTIDGWKVARERDTVAGVLELDQLPRLAQLGCEAADIRYAITGGKSGAGRPALTIEANGRLRVVCQRCTQPLEHRVGLATELVLAASEAEILDASDDTDRVLASQAMDIACLVEDEILLALPIAPTHERCALPASQTSAVAAALSVGGKQSDGSTREGKSSTPFRRVVQN